MADNANDNKQQPEQQAAQQQPVVVVQDNSHIEQLGKPASGFNTSLAKTESVLKGFAAVGLVVLGAAMLIKGHKMAKPMDIEKLVAKANAHLKTFGAEALHITAKEAKSFAEPVNVLTKAISKPIKVGGGIAAGAGVLGLFFSNAEMKSASSASRTRNYIEAKQKLDAQAQGQGR